MNETIKTKTLTWIAGETKPVNPPSPFTTMTAWLGRRPGETKVAACATILDGGVTQPPALVAPTLGDIELANELAEFWAALQKQRAVVC